MHKLILFFLCISFALFGSLDTKVTDMIQSEEMTQTWNTLVAEGVVEITATDKEVRPIFVGLQGIVEHVLASELNTSVKNLQGIIHTPMPATPLCTTGAISKELVDPSIENDPARLYTVKARTTILRDYLFKGGDLYIVYPKEGFNNRTTEQQEIYKQELRNYPIHLFDVPLDCDTIPLEMIGATYLFQNEAGQTFIFSIKMTQAKDPQELGHFGLWLGPLDHPAIQKRLKTISTFLEQQGVTLLRYKL